MNTDVSETDRRTASFSRLYDIIKVLRGEGGCPWDREQTPFTLRQTLIEEAYETVEAITDQQSDHVCEELGDVLLNVVMLSYMYEQEGSFCVSDVLEKVSDKLVRRHPHVFGETEGYEGPSSTERTQTAAKVLEQWDVIKRTVEGRTSDSILDEVSMGMPALERAYKLQKKAAKQGFDWTDISDVWNKIDEELLEVKEAVSHNHYDEIEDEIGDMLFAVVNLARHVKVDPGVALTRTNSKFSRRYRHVEKKMKEEKIEMDTKNLNKMDMYWNEAKKIERM